jgi:hypothetical protein
MRRLIVGLLLLVGTAQAAVLDSAIGRGTLASAQSGTGVSTNSVKVVGRPRALIITYAVASANATVQVEQSCDGANFFLVPSSSLTATTTAPAGIQINNPACEYRTNATACTACGLTTSYYLAAGQP